MEGKSKPDSVYSRLTSIVSRFVSSRKFYVLILTFMTLQAVWYATSFAPTILFDEQKHLIRINIYSEQAHPFVSEQLPDWDSAGYVPREPYYGYYFLMSIPFRLSAQIGFGATEQIILLRLINIAFVVTGVVIVRRALVRYKIFSAGVLNISLLIFTLTPLFAILPGSINYDNMDFLFISVMLHYAIKALNDKKPSFKNIASLLLFGMATVFIKWTNIALVLPVVIYIGVYLARKYKRRVLLLITKSFKTTKKTLKYGLLLALLLTSGLLAERHVYNTYLYGRPEVSCADSLPKERCLNFRDFAVYESVRQNKPDDFEPMTVTDYTMTMWVPRMINTQISLLPWDGTKLTSVIKPLSETYFFFMVLALISLTLNYKNILQSKYIRLLALACFVYILILVFRLYGAYVRNAIPAAINARYLLPVYYIIIALSVSSFYRVISGKYKQQLVALLLVFLLISTQGGGIITFSLTKSEEDYFRNNQVVEFNKGMKQIFDRIVIWN